MLVTLRTQADYLRMPWKNGGGSTTELAVYPARATVTEPFLWRLSLADVAASGAFSLFPGYERHLLQTAGVPMRLDHGVYGAKALVPDEAYQFSGDWPTSGALSGGAAQDLNLMVRRDVAYGAMRVLPVAAGSTLALVVSAPFTLLYVLRGEFAVQVPSGMAMAVGETLLLLADPVAAALGPAEVGQVRVQAVRDAAVVVCEVRLHGDSPSTG